MYVYIYMYRVCICVYVHMRMHVVHVFTVIICLLSVYIAMWVAHVSLVIAGPDVSCYTTAE